MPVKERKQEGIEMVRRQRGMCHRELLIGIEGIRNAKPYGCIFDFRLQGLTRFENIEELILKVAELDRLHIQEDIIADLRFLREGNRDPSGMNFQELLWSRGVREIFRLKILGRENGSLQGVLQGRLARGDTAFFRDMRELMGLMAEVPWGLKGQGLSGAI